VHCLVVCVSFHIVHEQQQPREQGLPETDGAGVLPTIQSGGHLPRKHSPDGASIAR